MTKKIEIMLPTEYGQPSGVCSIDTLSVAHKPGTTQVAIEIVPVTLSAGYCSDVGVDVGNR